VGGGSEAVGQVAQVVLDLAEGLAFGEIDEALGHLAEGLVGLGAEAVEEGLDAGFAVFGGR
jgi:hypothetical protein